ncbi:MAG: helix-turn-helix domain-containing protein [Acetobacterium sp.]
MGIGKNIKSFLKQKDMTVVYLSINTGIPSTTLYSLIKRDSFNEKQETLQKIAEALNIELKELTLGCYIFNYWLKRFREEKGLPIEEFANAVDIPVDIYKTFETDEDSPTMEELANIKSFIGEIPIDVMVGTTGNNRHKYDAKENHLLNMYRGLNDKGRDKAIESVELLTKVPEYKK